MRYGWRGYLATGVAALVVFELLPVGLPQDVVYLLVGLSSLAAIAAGIRIWRPTGTRAWWLMWAGQLVWVFGDTVSSFQQDVLHSDAYPSWADAFYLCAYPLIAAGLLMLTRGRRTRRDVAGWLDSATLTTALALLSWVLIARPTIEASQYSWSAAAVGVAYPFGDILLAGVLIRVLTTRGGRTPAFRWLMLAVCVLIAADTAYDVGALWFPSVVTNLDVLWLVSYLAWGVAALHPTMTTLSSSTDSQDARFTGRRLFALGTASMVAPMILAIEAVADVPIDAGAIAVGSAAMFLLVVSRMSVAIRDIVASTKERELLQRHLAYQAAHDALTDLPNRSHALKAIEAALSRAQRTGALFGLLFVDLDGFKRVNDTLGHRAGDEVLRTVASRLQSVVRAGDMVARLGGDEFVVLLESLNHESTSLDLAQRAVEIVGAPILMTNGRQVRVGASVGMAVSQDGSLDAQRLLHEADTACYRAKRAGRGRVEVFDQALRRELIERTDLENALSAAIADNSLSVQYQPIVNLSDDTIHGYEALVRWDHPQFGPIPPDEFIPTAELSDLICDLDTWVLKHATTQLARWTRAGMPRRVVAINLSGRHVCQPRVVDDVECALRESQLDPTQLVLEITETVLIDDLLAVDNLQRLRALGITVSIDDFGTGYNSITRLQHLPVDIIKIDRSFLAPTHGSPHALLELIVHTAHTFGLPVVAEGIELPQQLHWVRALSCEFGQGFYLFDPLTPDQVEQAEQWTPPLPDSLHADPPTFATADARVVRAPSD